MKMVKFENGDNKKKGEPIFINPEMVIAIEDVTIYFEDREGNLVADDGYVSEIFVSMGFGCTCKPSFKVMGKYDEVVKKLMEA